MVIQPIRLTTTQHDRSHASIHSVADSGRLATVSAARGGRMQICWLSARYQELGTPVAILTTAE
jgi:hypothetical protein